MSRAPNEALAAMAREMLDLLGRDDLAAVDEAWRLYGAIEAEQRKPHPVPPSPQLSDLDAAIKDALAQGYTAAAVYAFDRVHPSTHGPRGLSPELREITALALRTRDPDTMRAAINALGEALVRLENEIPARVQAARVEGYQRGHTDGLQGRASTLSSALAPGYPVRLPGGW